MSPTLCLILADDQPILREALERLLRATTGFQMLATGMADGWQAVDACAREQPNVLLLDLVMPGPGPAECSVSLQRVNRKGRAMNTLRRALHCLVFVVLVSSHLGGCAPREQAGIQPTGEDPATPVVALHSVVKSEWKFLASRSEPVVGAGASLAAHIVKVGREDPTLITVVYTLAPESDDFAGQQLTPVGKETYLVDQRGTRHRAVRYANLGRLGDVDLGALTFSVAVEGVRELTLSAAAVETPDGRRLDGPWELPLLGRSGDPPPGKRIGITGYRYAYADQRNLRISYDGWGCHQGGDRVAEMLADLGQPDVEEDASEWGIPVGAPTPAPGERQPEAGAVVPGPTATPAILPFDPAVANVGTLRVEDRETGEVRYLCVAIDREDQQVSLLNVGEP
jgi:CheY-like chemotaxis protein